MAGCIGAGHADLWLRCKAEVRIRNVDRAALSLCSRDTCILTTVLLDSILLASIIATAICSE